MKILEIGAVLIAAILTAIISFKWMEIGWVGRGALVFTILAAVFVAINSYNENKKQKLLEKINAKFGDISDLHGATIPTMQIGNSGVKFGLPNGVFNFSPFGPLIKLYIKEGRLYVNTIIRERSGDPIAVIDDNTWKLYKDSFEYNDDETSFELVSKGDRKIYFQIELRGGIAHICGLLFNDKGAGINFVDNGDPKGASMLIITPESKFDIMPDNAETIFKYPREKYYGKRKRS